VPCFLSDQDRSHYLFHLARLSGPSGCAVHAYCLMTNHVHLLVTPEKSDSCAKLMKHLGQLHTQYVNRIYRRTGSLWENRFKSCLVQSEHYVLECYRYIELNPVRAGMVEHPREYPWSSYLANAEGKSNPFLRGHPEYLNLGSFDSVRRKVYASLFGSHTDSSEADGIRSATRGGFALGDQSFRERIAQRLERRVERGTPGRPPGTRLDAAQVHDLFDQE
jgi:putative transposase